MSDLPQKSQFLIYQAESGAIKLDVRFENETVWLTQQHMAELFQVTPQNITLHLKAIFSEGELSEAATCKEYLQVRTEGTRQIRRALKHYNLDAIISVGFLGLNDRDILTHAGKISHELAVHYAETQYDAFHQQRLQEGETQPDDFEHAIQQLPKPKPARRGKKGTTK